MFCSPAIVNIAFVSKFSAKILMTSKYGQLSGAGIYEAFILIINQAALIIIWAFWV
jgi:hypothetical protein